MTKRSKSTTLTQKQLTAIITLVILIAAALLYVFKPDLFAQLTGQAPVASAPTKPASSAADTGPIANSSGAGTSAIQVFFTTPKYPDNKTEHTGSVEVHLTEFINTAKSTIDMAIYQFDLEDATQALLDANKRGVKIRVATDIDILNDDGENPWFLRLKKVGIPVIGGNSDGIMHNKFIVVDNQQVWMGTWNFTDNDTYRYNNVGLWIKSPELAKNYTAEFEKLFVDKNFGNRKQTRSIQHDLTIGGVRVENYFTPADNATDAINTRLKQAKTSIHFMAFSFTEDTTGQVLLDRAKAGVEVRGVFENTGSDTSFSEFGRLQKAKFDVMQDGNPYLMHHKIFIIDGQTVVVGSFNFSDNAQNQNDENLIIVDSPALAKLFEAEFLRVYATAQNPPNKK
jgi:phosphatidylserine/phosphatidylglycerophosphate/cardiolipin synthase-like enzyme